MNRFITGFAFDCPDELIHVCVTVRIAIAEVNLCNSADRIPNRSHTRTYIRSGVNVGFGLCGSIHSGNNRYFRNPDASLFALFDFSDENIRIFSCHVQIDCKTCVD
jgi:hypothetical protein